MAEAVAARCLPGAPKLAPFNPSSDEVLARFLELADVTDDDVVYDLGCGDGKVLVGVANRCPGAVCLGVEYDSQFYARAVEAVKCGGVADRVTIVRGDATQADLSDATVIFVFLTPSGQAQMEGKLRAAYDRGVRIVSNMFSCPSLGEPAETVLCDGVTKLHLYHQRVGSVVVGGGAAAASSETAAAAAKREARMAALDAALPESLVWLNALFDPAQNDVLIVVFTLAMLGFYGALLLMWRSGLALVHVGVMGTLATALFVTTHWWLSELKHEMRLKREREERCGSTDGAAKKLR